MKTLQFPMILTHRDNPHAQVVVASAEQLAEIPAEYLPADIGTLPAVVTAAAAIPGVNLDAGTTAVANTAEDTERRQSLDEAVDEFTAHVQAEENRLGAVRAQLDADRAELIKQGAALAEQSEALTRERAEFEAQRAAAAGTAAGTGDIGGDTGTASAAAEGAATGDTATPPAAPAKRTRAAAKAEG